MKEQNLVVEKLTMKTSTDSVKGAIYVVDAGARKALTTDVGPYYMALEDLDYSEVTAYTAMFVKQGYVEVNASLAGGAVEKGDYLGVTSTSGSVALLTVTAGSNEAQIVGVAEEAALTTDTTIKMTIGQAP